MKRIQSGGGQPTSTTIHFKDLYQEVDGDVAKIFVYLGTERIAEVTYPSQKRFIIGDQTGSTSVVTNATIVDGDEQGAVVQRTEYRPFGEISSLQGDGLSLDFGFAGVRREAALGLSDFGARFYSPSLGRFLTVDPLLELDGHPVSLNPYAYARNNPTSFTDVGGLDAVAIFEDLSVEFDFDSFMSDLDAFNDLEAWLQFTPQFDEEGQIVGYVANPPEVMDSSGPLQSGIVEEVTVTAPSFSLGDAANIAGLFAVGFVPGAGEILDFVVLVDPASTPVERTIAGVSLAANVFLPMLPKFGRAGRLIEGLDDAASGAGRATTGFIDDVTVVSHGKVIGRGTVDVRAIVQGIQTGKLSPRDIFRNDQGLLPKQGPGYYQECIRRRV